MSNSTGKNSKEKRILQGVNPKLIDAKNILAPNISFNKFSAMVGDKLINERMANNRLRILKKNQDELIYGKKIKKLIQR